MTLQNYWQKAQIYITAEEDTVLIEAAMLVNKNDDWLDDMQRCAQLEKTPEDHFWSSVKNDREVIQFTVSQETDAIVVSCKLMTMEYVEFHNYSDRTVKVVNRMDAGGHYKVAPLQMRCFSHDELIAPPEIEETFFRKPAYWMRGKPVTEEQAFEIIRRTDNYFWWCECNGLTQKDFISVYTIDSWWFDNGSGWCRPDGRIGLDFITQRWPEQQDFILDGLCLLKAFPFLDMILILWDCEEEFGFESDGKGNVILPEILYGVYIHDKSVDILPPDDAWNIFCRYQLLYGEDPATYLEEYPRSCEKVWVDQEYFKRCVRTNGLREEEIKQNFLGRQGERRLIPLRADRVLRYRELREACRKLEASMKDS